MEKKRRRRRRWGDRLSYSPDSSLNIYHSQCCIDRVKSD